MRIETSKSSTDWRLNCTATQNPPASGGFLMRLNGVEPSRPVRDTRPSTLRVYQFRHSRSRGDDSRCLAIPGLLVADIRVGRYSCEQVFERFDIRQVEEGS